MLVDSHCHLDFPEFAPDLDAVMARKSEAGVRWALCISVSLEAHPGVLAVAERFPGTWASVGVHPDHTKGEEPSQDRLLALADHPKVVAIGETGLDYYRLEGDLEWQRERFRTHIRVARQCQKPLVVHTRSAPDDTIRIMREEGADAVGGVMHCFTESWDTARAALDLGFYLSFSGILTFKNAETLRDVARRTPMDRLLVETDAPYLAPVPKRGQINEPAYVRYVAEELARVRNLPPDTVAALTTENFFRLFNHACP